MATLKTLDTVRVSKKRRQDEKNGYTATKGENPWGCRTERVANRYSKTATLCPKPKIENEIKEQTRWR